MPELTSEIPRHVSIRPPIAILGVPFDNVTTAETLAAVEQMVASGQPHYLVTANVDFLVQAQSDVELRRILVNAHMVLCDGTPLVWASRLLGNRLPERVAGADLVPVLLELAADKQYRVFFLGATPASAGEAVARLQRALPSLIIAGHYSPPIQALSEMDHEEIKRRVRQAGPDLLFVAFGCPKAEKWIARHYLQLGVPVVAGVGATIDFLAGRVKRAPPWMRRAGLEWMFRLAQEPRRLWRRYARDAWVFGWRLLLQWALLSRGVGGGLGSAIECAGGHYLVDLSGVSIIDSTGIGLLLVLQKKIHAVGRELVLAAPSVAVRRALRAMHLAADFVIAPDLAAARRLLGPPVAGRQRLRRRNGRWRVRIGISTSVIQHGQTGIAQYVFALVRALLDHGQHEYTLFVLEKDLDQFQFAAGRGRLTTIGERFRPPMKDILWHQTVLPGLARRLGVDVLHVPSYRRMLWSRPCPLVATIHDLAPFHLRGKYDWRRTLYGRAVVPPLARRQDQIVAISENTARDVTRFFRVPRDRLTVIYNGLDHSRFFPDDTDRAKALSARRFGLERPFFLYVARLEHPGKNHTALIAAFNQFKVATVSDWQLALAGADWHGALHIHKAIQESPFARDIRCLGFVPDTFVPDLYRAADVFVYPSLFEGFGMPPLEAMACGCPVISSARGSLSEVLGNAAVLVDPEDVNALTSQLCALSAGTALRHQLSVAGLARARRFDWAATALAMVRVYERAAQVAKAANHQAV